MLSFPLRCSEAAAASLTESSLSVVPSFHVCSYSSYKLRKAGPQLFACTPLQKKKRHAQNSSFVEKRSFANQAVDPDFTFRLTVFVNEESSSEPVVCGLRLTLPVSLSHFRENLITFCQLEFFFVSLRLPQRHDKVSFPLLCFLFFFC